MSSPYPYRLELRISNDAGMNNLALALTQGHGAGKLTWIMRGWLLEAPILATPCQASVDTVCRVVKKYVTAWSVYCSMSEIR